MLHMWHEWSSVKPVDLVKKMVTVTEIMYLSKGLFFYWCTLYIQFIALCAIDMLINETN